MGMMSGALGGALAGTLSAASPPPPMDLRPGAVNYRRDDALDAARYQADMMAMTQQRGSRVRGRGYSQKDISKETFESLSSEPVINDVMTGAVKLDKKDIQERVKAHIL